MDKRNRTPLCTDLWLLLNRGDSETVQMVHSLSNIIDLETDMVNSLATLLEKF